MANERRIMLRLLLGLGVGFLVSILALAIAWQNMRREPYLRGGQFGTHLQFETIAYAMEEYQQMHQSFPSTLGQLAPWGIADRNGDVTDGWRRPFHYSVDSSTYVVSSYGRDGRPGGSGLDYDLTNADPWPAEAIPTLRQFLFEMPTGGITLTCLASGVPAFLVALVVIRPHNLQRKIPIVLLAKITVTVVAAACVGAVMSAFHIPSGH